MNLTPEQAAAATERAPCPNCAVPAGSPCRTRAGKTTAKYHTARFMLIPALRENLAVAVPADRHPGKTWKPGPAVTAKVIDDDMLTFTRALRHQGTPMPEIAKKLTIKTGKNAGAHPSVASLYRALAEAAETSGPTSESRA